MSIPWNHRFILAVVCALALSGATHAADTPEPRAASSQAEVARPTGAYALMTLKIDGLPVRPADWPIFVPFRENVGRVSHPVGITRDGGRLERSGDTIAGTFEVSLPPAERKGPTHHAQAKLDLSVNGASVTGKCTVGESSHEVTGTWRTEAELNAANSLDPKAVWPMWIGPVNGGTCATDTGVQLVDSLANARLVWRSEAPIGNNMGSINRFMGNLASSTGIRTSGQSSSPVHGGGLIFLHQRVPAGAEFGWKVGHTGTSEEEVKAAGFDELPWYAMEKHRLKAREQVIAIDAVTGKTIWISTLPIEAPNIQHHKDRGGDRTPAYADGRLLGLAYNGQLFCVDAKTGELLWRNDSPGRMDNPALAVAGNVVIAPAKPKDGLRGFAWAAFDIATGKLLWTAPQIGSSNSVNIIRRGGKHYALVPTSDQPYGHGGTEGKVTLYCIEAETGTVVWSMPFAMASNRLGIAAIENLKVTFEFKPAFDPDKAPRGNKYIEGLVCGYRLHDDKAERLWEVETDLVRDSQPLIMHDGRYVVAIGSGYSDSKDLHKVIDAETGKVVSSATGVGPQNGGYVQAMGDLALVRRDGTHGRIEFAAYEVDPQGRIRPLPPEQWAPPGPHTTSYHHPAMYPLLDGRMYVRQADGIYCYDLRKTGSAR